MTNAEVYQKVARRELDPMEAADQLRAEDKAAKDRLRPRWLPRSAWVILVWFVTIIIAAFGGQQEA